MEISARFGSITIYKSGNNTTAALLPREFGSMVSVFLYVARVTNVPVVE